MGTHPIFESDFDCLTDICSVRGINVKFDTPSVFEHCDMLLGERF